jgi:hypothetical protein
MIDNFEKLNDKNINKNVNDCLSEYKYDKI